MSTLYEMAVTITGQARHREEQIISSANAEWSSFASSWCVENTKSRLMSASGEGCLHLGESDIDFSERLVKAIFAANGVPCNVKVRATYLEDAPFEEYEYDEKDFKEIFEKGKKNE